MPDQARDFAHEKRMQYLNERLQNNSWIVNAICHSNSDDSNCFEGFE